MRAVFFAGAMVTCVAPSAQASDLDALQVGREPLWAASNVEVGANPPDGDSVDVEVGANPPDGDSVEVGANPPDGDSVDVEAAALPADLDPNRSSGGSADAEQLLRPGTRPMFFNIAFGPVFFALNRDIRGSGFNRSRGKLAFDFGYHFSGEFDGPAIGATIEQTIDDDLYTIHPGFKFWWDIQVVEEYEIDVTPFADVGYMLLAFDNFTEHAFVFAFGVEGRVLLDDRWLLLFRPIHVQNLLTSIDNSTFLINFSVLVGGGVTF